MRYAIYEPDTGQILKIISGTVDDPPLYCDGDQTFIEISGDASDATHYINTDTLRPNLRGSTPCTPSRTAIPADGVTPITLTQMRANTVVTLTGPVSGEMTCEGTDTITLYKPGKYTITAQAPFPALPKEIAIEAH